MLITAYVISFLGMIVLPFILWIYFRRKFELSWKLVLAGGLTFIGSQIPHIPLVLGLNNFLHSTSLLVNSIILGLLAGIFRGDCPLHPVQVHPQEIPFVEGRRAGRLGSWRYRSDPPRHIGYGDACIHDLIPQR
jgi:hypothetical protein